MHLVQRLRSLCDVVWDVDQTLCGTVSDGVHLVPVGFRCLRLIGNQQKNSNTYSIDVQQYGAGAHDTMSWLTPSQSRADL